jgi:TonB-dependent receptor
MTRTLLLSLLVAAAGLSGLSALSLAAESRTLSPDASATGTITGRVQNAVTGRFLANARVSVAGTTLTTLSDPFGFYRLSGVPSGPVTLEIFYTGLDPLHVPLQLTASATLVHDATLTSASRYGQGTEAVQLDVFVVAQAREVEGDALATNEQRFSPNLKQVVATDVFGDVQEGNVGEFLKFLPGVLVNYVDAEARDLSLRGFAPNLTEFTVDGAQTSNANYFGSSRAPHMSQTSITGASRVEVSKVPTPSSSAASLAGSVNLVSKSAFERNRAEFRYRAYLSANSLSLRFREPYTYDDQRVYKILPNVDFDFTLPVNKNFGLVLTGLASNFFNPQRFHQSVWTAAATGTNASLSSPYLSSDVTRDSPRFTWRKATGLSADWRIARDSVLSLGLNYSDFHSQGGNNTRTFGTGTNGTPTIAVASGGIPLTFGPDFTQGATGRGAVNLTSETSNRLENTLAGSIRYRFDNGLWRIHSGLNRSASTAQFRGGGNGWVFNSLTATYATPVRVSYTNVTPLGAEGSTTVVRAFANDGREVDYGRLADYRVTTAAIGGRSITDDVVSGDVSIRRRLGFLPFPVSVEAGALQREQRRDSRIPVRNFTYNGLNGDFSAAPYRMTNYVNQDSGFGARDVAFINVVAASRAYQINSALITQTPAQVAAEAVSRINTSEYIREKVTAWYGQMEFQFLNNRLRVLTGVRHEQTDGHGQGPIYDPGAAFVRNANGTFALDTRGQRIRKPAAGAAGSLEEVALTRQERANHTRGSYGGYYPSLHVTANPAENTVIRVAYARTYGRPNFSELIPNVVINERDLTAEDLTNPAIIPGSLTVRNPNLKPWLADNYDLSLEHYTREGGVFSLGAFQKEIRDFFADVTRIASVADIAQLGLDPRYEGFQLSTSINSGNARIRGYELSVRHSLAPVAAWGRHFTVFANGSRLQLDGTQNADFAGFMPKSAAWGITYSRAPWIVMAKWNWRGLQRNGAFAALGPDSFNYLRARTHLDLNLDYQLRRRLGLFCSIRNVFNVPNEALRYGSLTPAYARMFMVSEFGAQITAGVKGSF